MEKKNLNLLSICQLLWKSMVSKMNSLSFNFFNLNMIVYGSKLLPHINPFLLSIAIFKKTELLILFFISLLSYFMQIKHLRIKLLFRVFGKIIKGNLANIKEKLLIFVLIHSCANDEENPIKISIIWPKYNQIKISLSKVKHFLSIIFVTSLRIPTF